VARPALRAAPVGIEIERLKVAQSIGDERAHDVVGSDSRSRRAARTVSKAGKTHA